MPPKSCQHRKRIDLLEQIQIKTFQFFYDSCEFVIISQLLLCKISGDEILAINGKVLQGVSHDEAINEFRAIKNGRVVLKFARREIIANGR